MADSSSLASYSIASAGSEIDSTYQVISVRVERSINRIAEAEIVIRDGNPSDQTFVVADSDTFKPGAEIEIKLGYHNSNTSVFKGIVTKQSIGIGDDGPVLTVICKDKWVKSTLGANQFAFENQTSSAIIETIAGNYSLEKDVSATSYSHPKLVQYKTRDWDMIVNLAEKEGLVAVTNSGKLTIAEPNVSMDPSLEIHFGNDTWDFTAEVDSSNQIGSLTGTAWDVETQAKIEVTANEPTVNTQGNLSGSNLAEVFGSVKESLTTSTNLDQDGIQAWADASLLKMRLSSYSGSLTFSGNSDVVPNSLIKLIGFGDRFNGNAFVSGVVHLLEDGTWKTEANLGLSPKWIGQKTDLNGPDTVSAIPAYQGVQIGKVKAIINDPDNDFRVQVEIPFLHSDDQLIWARLSSHYTGDSFGSFFMPEIDSEVILVFINNDPSSAVILGSMFSSKIPAPLTPAEDTDIKMLKTSSGLTIEFDDSDDKVIMTLSSPKGNKIVLSEEDEALTITDQNSNEIKMTADEMTIDSKSKLVIKATDEIDISSPKISVSGSDSYSLSGGKVEVSSDGKVDITAGGAANIKSSGAMSVKGSAVNLN